MRYYKKIILFFLLTVFLFSGIFSFVLATEVALPGWDPEAVERRELLPAYIRYIFELSLMIVGLIAFGVLVYAGFCYLTSVGDPTKISDAKDRILSAFLGLVILLASYLILVTIDPHLVVLKAPELPFGAGVSLYDARGNSKFFSANAFKIAKDFNAVRYELVKISPKETEIRAWSKEGFKGEEQLFDEQAGALVFSPRSLEFKLPEPPFDFAFTIEPEEARIDSKYNWWHDWPGSNATDILLKANLTAGTPETVTFSVKNVPARVDPSFPERTNCTPTCDRRLTLIANGATAGRYNIVIEARYQIEGQPQPPKSKTFRLEIYEE